MNQVFKLFPGLSDVIAHTLCEEDLIFQDDSEVVYKDLAFLTHNRMTHLVVSDGEDHEPCEIIVIDTLDGQENCDLDKLTYF